MLRRRRRPGLAVVWSAHLLHHVFSVCYTLACHGLLRHFHVHLLARPLDLVGHGLWRVAVDAKQPATATAASIARSRGAAWAI